MTATETRELLYLYQKVSSQLSFARNQYDDSQLNSKLNGMISRANFALYQRKTSPSEAIQKFFTIDFPAAFWHLRWYIVIAFLVTMVPSFIAGFWLGNTPEALDFIIPESQRAVYVEDEFEQYYSAKPAMLWSIELMFHNTRVAFLTYAGGALLGLGALYILLVNGTGLGIAMASFIEADDEARFWSLILPHGLLELTSIIVAGGAGIALGWSFIAPGNKWRSESFTEQARRSSKVMLGLGLCFIAAGFIEAFITPSSLPVPLKITIGALALGAFLFYGLVVGRKVSLEGHTGV